MDRTHPQKTSQDILNKIRPGLEPRREKERKTKTEHMAKVNGGRS